MSDDAQMTYNKIKHDIIAVNHTDRPHNHLQFPCDTEHTVTESLELTCGSASNFLVA